MSKTERKQSALGKKRVNLTEKEKQLSLGEDENVARSISSESIGSTGTYTAGIATALMRRNRVQLFDGGAVKKSIVTPKLIDVEDFTEEFQRLEWRIKDNVLIHSDRRVVGLDRGMTDKRYSIRRSTIGGMKTNLEDIIQDISTSLITLTEKSSAPSDTVEVLVQKDDEKTNISPFVKVILRQTNIIQLYEQRSITVEKDSEEGQRVEEDNKLYEHLTIGRGKNRRKADAETQTMDVLYKSRSVNTETIQKLNVGSYVSNYDMFDTYKSLEKSTKSVLVDGQKQLEITTYNVDGEDQFQKISRLPSFNLATMLTQRILAGNVFKEGMRRFRNMYLPDPLSMDVVYRYRTDVLWEFINQGKKQRNAVASMSWCPSNGDILAVGYGVYAFTFNTVPSIDGCVCIWSIKNPVNPERRYDYNVPVVCVEFSPFVPQLLAIGLYDGTVEVRDITNDDEQPVAVSQRNTSPGYEPVMQIKWIQQIPGENLQTEPFLAVSQDGSITKYRLVNSPHLVGFLQMRLDRVEGTPEGLFVKRSQDTIEAYGHPQGMSITLHPTKPDIYFVLTDEGCLHKCSTNYSHQHLELWQAHEGCVYSMEFSPWSPKLFLTCGSDWFVRIWLEGIFQPLITLYTKIGPVHCAHWSKTHSTIVMTIARNALNIWDLRRSTLNPVSSTSVAKSYLTMAEFSLCGRSVALGNERGTVFLCAFEDMPFTPHYQYDELQAAIFKGIAAFPELTRQVKNLGFFGYQNKK